jgi:Putative zinc-finger
MNCNDVKAQLPFLLSEDREQPEDLELRAHLAQCPSCVQEWQELQQLGKLLADNPEPVVAVDLVSLYRRAALQEARSSRRWRWVGMAASILLLIGGAGAVFSRVEIRLNGQELAVRWGAPPAAVVQPIEHPPPQAPAAPVQTEKRDDQMEVLSAMVRAMLQELQTVELRQGRDRADLDLRVSGLQEQTLKRWLALQKDMEALYVLTQKGD